MSPYERGVAQSAGGRTRPEGARRARSFGCDGFASFAFVAAFSKISGADCFRFGEFRSPGEAVPHPNTQTLEQPNTYPSLPNSKTPNSGSNGAPRHWKLATFPHWQHSTRARYGIALRLCGGQPLRTSRTWREDPGAAGAGRTGRPRSGSGSSSGRVLPPPLRGTPLPEGGIQWDSRWTAVIQHSPPPKAKIRIAAARTRGSQRRSPPGSRYGDVITASGKHAYKTIFVRTSRFAVVAHFRAVFKKCA